MGGRHPPRASEVVPARAARERNLHMKPLPLLLILLLSLGLVCAGGCNKNKKDPNDPAASKSGRHKTEQDKLDAAQREAKQNPDKFESASDPPLTADTRFAAGQLAEYQGDLNRAVAQFVEALKIDPNHKNSLFHLGAVYTQLGRYNDAVTIWQR